MPILNLSVSGDPDADLAKTLATGLVELTQTQLRKDPRVTSVAVAFIAPEHWFVGGPSLAAQRLTSFWLDIKVVDGTNTKQELGAYQAAVFALMQRQLGPLHDESYILVHEVPAAAYGFGGKTQEHRYIAAEIAAATTAL